MLTVGLTVAVLVHIAIVQMFNDQVVQRQSSRFRAQLEQQRAEALLDSYTAQRRLTHEFTNHMSALSALQNQGDMEGAAKFLGHPYTVTGIVEHGRRVGTSVLGVPTVNLRLPAEMALPPYGVYATRVLVDGKSYIAATNIGVKPTFLDGGAPTIEPHLLDFSGDLYGRMIHVELHKFLRPEMQFESVEALKNAIDENVRQTRELFAGK